MTSKNVIDLYLTTKENGVMLNTAHQGSVTYFLNKMLYTYYVHTHKLARTNGHRFLTSDLYRAFFNIYHLKTILQNQ